jgi:guanylate kinase
MAEKILGNLSEGLLFIVSAPAGTGKTTLVRMLTKEFSCVVESVSCTTRPPRAGEVEGKDYFFMPLEAFERKKAKGDFLESAEVFGHMYGTSKEFVDLQRKKGKHVVLVIDTQGALQLQALKVEATYVFIAPPDFEVLEKRLLGRQTETEQEREKRLSWAHREMELALAYDFFVVNTQLEVAYEVLKSILIAEEHRVGH